MTNVNSKIAVYHFHNGSGGGVLSVIRNLLLYKQHSVIENHVIYTINKDKVPAYQAPGLTDAKSESVFYYSPRWNFYYTCKQLAKLLPDEKAVIVAHDWLELGMVSHLGLRNPLIFFLHGDYPYYYQLAQKHSVNIDVFLCVSQSIKAKLTSILTSRSSFIYYKHLPVRDVPRPTRLSSSKVVVGFAGRCSKEKGYYLLPIIQKYFIESGLSVEWHIAGEGSDTKDKQSIWDDTSGVFFYGQLAQEKLDKLYGEIDYFILPSFAEGTPLSVVEAMKTGAIPLVNNIEGGLQEIVIKNETGFLVDNNSPAEYARIIEEIERTPEQKQNLSRKASTIANSLFDASFNTQSIEKIILDVSLHSNKPRAIQRIYGSRLDRKWLPNFLVKLLRSFKIITV